MPLTISDETLKQMGLSEREAQIEVACRLFDAGKLSLPAAGKLAGLERPEFERELLQRGIPAYRPSVKDLEDDLAALKRLGI
jgi:predicted HTH domain antitoxin